jgi:hypothetical protein
MFSQSHGDWKPTYSMLDSQQVPVALGSIPAAILRSRNRLILARLLMQSCLLHWAHLVEKLG